MKKPNMMLGRFLEKDWINQVRPNLKVDNQMSTTALYHIRFMNEDALIDEDVFFHREFPDGTVCFKYANRSGGCILTPMMIIRDGVKIDCVRPEQTFTESYFSN